jgi:hypothetical protein
VFYLPLVDDGNWKSKNHSNDDEDKSNNGNAGNLHTSQAQTVKTVKVQEGEILHQVQSPSKEDEK